MDIIYCSDCDRLRADYRRITRRELDLAIKLDEAAKNDDNDRLHELRSLLTAVGRVRNGACQSVLDHEKQHVSRTALIMEDDQASAA